jgi:serine/threonine protein phosphatase PrpC
MRFVTATCTDVGIKKKTNQDSMLVMQAETDYGPVLFASVCDGMGGLAKGEVASAAAVGALSFWFRNTFPKLLYDGLRDDSLRESLTEVIQETSDRIGEYGSKIGVSLGTTIVALLIVSGRYYIVNVGDCRAYRIERTIELLTHDQTVVQHEVDLGRLTVEEAQVDPRRSVLLQCVGATDAVLPDFFTGSISGRENFMLCCDGFRHVISSEELFAGLNPQTAATEQQMAANLQYYVDTNKYRKETDNISALLVHLC